jgi:peptidoglycan DL-endopeptidase CwlO
VLYVIWYRQIWFPGSGWRQYHGAGGASGQHTNHVHLSLI